MKAIIFDTVPATTKSTITRVSVLLSLLIALFANVVAAQDPARELQLSTDSGTRLVVIFSARSPRIEPLSPGHAFVSFGKTNANLETCVTATYGFYPCDGCSVFTDENPGRVVKGYTKNRSGNKHLGRLAILSDTQFAAPTTAVVEKWQKIKYNLVRRNCVRFISEVAAAQGLVTPSTTYWGIFPKLPKKYIRQLEKANPNRQITLPGFDEYGMPECLDENNNGIPDRTEIVENTDTPRP
jgi:hypothetical protein